MVEACTELSDASEASAYPDLCASDSVDVTVIVQVGLRDCFDLCAD